MCTSKPKKPPDPPPPPAAPPSYVDRDVQGTFDTDKRRQRAASGRSSTILTGGAGLTTAAPVGKTVLGGAA